MSWDLTAIKTKRHVQSVSDLTEEDCVPLEHQQMITELKKIAKACGCAARHSRPVVACYGEERVVDRIQPEQT